jgi:hypothetical protein
MILHYSVQMMADGPFLKGETLREKFRIGNRYIEYVKCLAKSTKDWRLFPHSGSGLTPASAGANLMIEVSVVIIMT